MDTNSLFIYEVRIPNLTCRMRKKNTKNCAVRRFNSQIQKRDPETSRKRRTVSNYAVEELPLNS
jgi:hypothetical protein